jgi:hypothetical protein
MTPSRIKPFRATFTSPLRLRWSRAMQKQHGLNGAGSGAFAPALGEGWRDTS